MSAPDRVSVLRAVIAFSEPKTSWQSALSTFPWDVDEPLVTLQKSDVLSILDRYLIGNLSGQQVAEWANLLECREDIEYSEESADILSVAVHQLANPLLEGELSIPVAVELKRTLEIGQVD